MNLALILLPLLVCTACGTTSRTTAAAGTNKPDTQGAAQKVTVSGTVTQTFSYCGGAAPSDEMLAELATPKLFAGKKLHVIKGDTNTTARAIITTVITDAAGNFSFAVEPGTYSIILDEQVSAPDAKKYKTQTQSIDESCYLKWWGKPYYILEVEGGSKTTAIKGLNFNFHKRCFLNSDVPCLDYDGPYPP